MDETRREVLRAIADTVVPGIQRSPDPDGFWALRGSELGVDEATAQAIEQLPGLQGVDRRRQRLSHRLGHQPDDHDHGTRPAHGRGHTGG